MTRFICNDAIVQPNNSSFIRQTPLIMLIVCVCPHSFNAKDIRARAHGEIWIILHIQWSLKMTFVIQCSFSYLWISAIFDSLWSVRSTLWCLPHSSKNGTFFPRMSHFIQKCHIPKMAHLSKNGTFIQKWHIHPKMTHSSENVTFI